MSTVRISILFSAFLPHRETKMKWGRKVLYSAFGFSGKKNWSSECNFTNSWILVCHLGSILYKQNILYLHVLFFEVIPYLGIGYIMKGSILPCYFWYNRNTSQCAFKT